MDSRTAASYWWMEEEKEKGLVQWGVLTLCRHLPFSARTCSLVDLASQRTHIPDTYECRLTLLL